MKNNFKDTIILDIETQTTNNEVNPDKDIFRLAGCYSYNDDKKLITANLKRLQEEIDKARYIVTFNGKFYDIPILERHGIDFKYKIQIDLKELIKKRAGIIMIPEGRLIDNIDYYSLDNILKLLRLSCGKTGMDFKILQKEKWTDEEKKILSEYLFNDIEITKQLYEWVEKTFESFKFGLSEKDIQTKKYLTTSPSVDCYKFICNVTGMEEIYDDNNKGGTYKGAFVAAPTVESAKGNIVCLDFTSAYPSSFIQNNLFSLDPANGMQEFNLYKLKGKYNTEKRGKVEEAIYSVFKKRLEYKKNKDVRDYCLKIRLNIIYGLSGSGLFKSVHDLNPDAASDCTLMVRSWIRFARDTFEKHGIKFLYADTDSNYLDIGEKPMSEVLQIRDEIITEIKKNVIFPMPEFNMGVDAEIKYIQFFKDKAKTKLAKKHYLYVTKDDKLKIKGLQIIKSNTSQLSKLVFEKYIKPVIIKELRCKFSKLQIEKWVLDELNKDISLIQTRFYVKDINSYKNSNGLHAQLSIKYGAGIHYLIKNKIMGVGKGVKYCKMEEFKGTIKDLDIGQVLSQLDNFIIIKEQKTKSLFGGV